MVGVESVGSQEESRADRRANRRAAGLWNEANPKEHCKERGEWAELMFMARARREGLIVLKPYGESACYDVAVDWRGRFWRVQVKSTLYRRRNGEYSLNVLGPKRQAYAANEVDFFAVYLIPIGAWYIIPYEAAGREHKSLHFTVNSARHKYRSYREAWHLLRRMRRVRRSWVGNVDC